LNAGKIRLESTCCILEKSASMSYGDMSTGSFALETIKNLYLELEGDELVDLVNLIVDGGRGIKSSDGDRCRVSTWFPPRRVCGYMF